MRSAYTELSTLGAESEELDSKPLLESAQDQNVHPDREDTDTFEATNGMSTGSRPKLFNGLSVSRVALVIVLCLPLAFLLVDIIVHQGTSLYGAIFVSGVKRVHGCQDPYFMPGYLHRYRANATQRMRFLPYWQDLTQQDRDGDNELQAMRSGIPAYSTWIADEPNLSNVTALHSLRGKNVLLMGCSTDRNAIRSFCSTHDKASPLDIKHHRWAYCKIPSLEDLTLQSFFHYGMHQDAYFKGQDREGNATTFEDRFREIYRPLMMPGAGEPDLIILSSGEWDYDFFRYQERIASGDTPEEALISFRKLTKSQLLLSQAEWYQMRLGEVIHFLRAEFPGKPIMWRTIGPYGGGSDRNQFIFQLNQAAKKVMSDMDIPIFRWSDFLSGTQEDNQYNDGRTDNLHFITGSRPDWLYGEMMLYYLAEYTKTDGKGIHCT